jgi:hypothetical protein
MQAEIDHLKAEITRLVNRPIDFAVQEHSSATHKTYVRRRRKTKTVAARGRGAVFERTQPAKNLIVFPNRSA